MYFDNIAASLETLFINLMHCNADKSNGPGLVVQMLTIAAIRAPRLNILMINDSDDKAEKAATT